MKYALLIFLCITTSLFAQTPKTKILILGSDHLAQIYRSGNPNTDVLLPRNQKSIDAFNARIARFEPDAIMIEALPEMQNEIDSLYKAYQANQLNLGKMENGRSEIFNIAFNIGKKSKVEKIICVNAPGGTSQSILDNGDNIALYKEYGKNLRKIVVEKYQSIGKGELPFGEYLTFLNQPEAYNLIYRLRYVVPARVTNGQFKNPEKTIDTTKIDKQHIGAELISIFKNRDYKIYSNVIANQLRTKPKRILLITGVAHIGSLKNIFNEDPDFEVINATQFLQK